MERIFDNRSKYGPVANQLDREVHDALRPIIVKHAKQGYCPRDIHYVAVTAVQDLVLEMIIKRDMAESAARTSAGRPTDASRPTDEDANGT